MRLSKEDLRNYSILAVFAIAAGTYLYLQLRTPDVSAPAAPAVTSVAIPATGAGRASVATLSSAPLDPTLHMEGMLLAESLVYSGNGRNIFSISSAPVLQTASARKPIPIPMAIAPVRPVQALGPPAPPPIDLRFFGTETSASGKRRGFLLHGDDVFLVSSGDIVQRRYRVLSIEARSMTVEDIANNNRQTLPLLAN
jgi:hypothetical protein